MFRVAALMGFALLLTLVGGFMTFDADMQADQAGVYAQDSN